MGRSMDQKGWLIVACAGWLVRAAVLAAIVAVRSVAAERPPNFVIILTDDLGYGDLGVYGHPSIRTPNIDRIAAEGVRLTEFYSASPQCTPARAALLTGRYPLRSGLVRVLVPKEKWGIPPSEITLAEALKELGYATAIVGKWHLGGRRPFRPMRHGFDMFYGLLHSNDMTLLPIIKWPRIDLLENDRVIESPAKVRSLTRRYTERAAEFITENRGRPFFLYLSHTMPHVPLKPSKEFKGRSAHGVYGDVVEELDWSTGEILKTLEENGLAENTFVVFSSDNGPYLGGVDQEADIPESKRRKMRGSAGPLRGAKGTTWEGGMRVPMVARWPRGIPAEGAARGGIATMMDLFTTFIELAGGEIPADRTIDGKNIMPLLRGTSGSPHTEFFYPYRDQIFAVRSGDWKLHFYKRELAPRGKPGKPTPCVPPELYNLAEDPGERHNRAADHPEIVERLQELAKSFQESLDPTMKLPPASKSVFSGLTTQAPKNPSKTPK